MSKPIESALKPKVEEAWLTLVHWLMKQRPSKARSEVANALDVIRAELEKS